MRANRYLLLEVILIVAAIAGTAMFYRHLPVRLPTHWDFDGRVNGYGPRWLMFVFGPGLMTVLAVVSFAGQWLSPRRFSVQNFRATYESVMLILICLMGYIEFAIVWSAMQHKHAIGRQLIIGGLCVFFALVGNMLGKVRRNFIIGIRTPWTLANERVWNATHRFAAKVFVVAGLCGLVLAVCGWYRGPLVAILLGAASPAIYSLAYYKRLERLGEL